ncbi:MAG: response regulator, partial [Bacteroidetes bacterium]|nr:response regulator [Bacteroidota bacterium]
SVSYSTSIIPNKELLNKKFEILLVEDDKFNSLFLQAILESIGIVSLANDGNEAIQLIKNKIEQNKIFDIVILDINLPENWEGIALKKEIIKNFNQYNNVPFIAQSAYSQKSDKQRILDEGFTDFLTKPIDSEKLLNIIKNYLVKKV